MNTNLVFSCGYIPRTRDPAHSRLRERRQTSLPVTTMSMSERWMELPEKVKSDEKSEDIIRVWGLSGERGQIFAVRLERFEDPAA